MNAFAQIAFRNIFRQRRRSFLTGLSLWGGYVLVSLSIALTDGTYSHMIDAFTGDRTGHIQIHQKNYLEKPSVERMIPNQSQILETLQNMSTSTLNDIIKGFSPRVRAGALAWAHDQVRPVEVWGIDPEKESTVTRFGDKPIDGEAWSNIETALTPVYVGHNIRKQLKLKFGEELILISQGADGSIANDKFFVSGTIGTEDGSDADSLFIPLEAAKNFFSSGIHEIAVRLQHSSSADRVRGLLVQKLTHEEIQISTWAEVEEEFYKAMQADRRGNEVTYIIILIMVCVGVLNAVLMTTLERMREYGLMKAVGTPPVQMFMMIPLEILFLSLFSVGLGALTALPINYWFFKVGITFEQPVEISGILFDRMRAEITTSSMIIPALVVIGMATAVSLIPAIIAHRKTALDALRSV